jgi:hypothetical protein
MIISQIVVYNEHCEKIILCIGNNVILRQNILQFKRKITSLGHICSEQGETIIVVTTDENIETIYQSIKTIFPEISIKDFR